MSFDWIPRESENHALGWALHFAGLGQRVFPIWGVDHQTGIDLKTGDEATRLANSGKTPMVSWTEWATTDADTIRAWGRAHPDCNWGIVLGEGMIVVDCDSQDAVELFDEMWERDPQAEPSLVIATARGQHVYFWGDSRTYKPHPEIDVKGRGGYVVLPGSVSWNASVYYAYNPKTPIGNKPEWIGSQARERASDGATEGELRLGPGERNVGLMRAMGSLRRMGLGNSQMLDALRSMNELICDPPLSEQELEETCSRGITEWERGTDIEDMVAASHMFQGEDAHAKVFLTKADRGFRPPPTWTYEGLIPGTGIGQLYGATGTGKTFIMLDLMLSYCNGMPWGTVMPTYRGGTAPDGTAEARDHILYVMAEGSFDIDERIKAWCHENGGDDEKLITVEEQMYDLATTSGWITLFKDLEDDAHMVSIRHKIGMCVLDTQSLLLLGAAENDNTAMNVAMQAAKSASKYLGCPVIFVHHEGRGEGGHDRGASAVKGAMDFQIRVTGPAPVLEVAFKKIKAAPVPQTPMPYVLKPVLNSLVASSELEDVARVASDNPNVQMAKAYIEEHGPTPFSALRNLVGILPTDTQTRNIFMAQMRAQGLYTTGETVRNSPVWDVGEAPS